MVVLEGTVTLEAELLVGVINVKDIKGDIKHFDNANYQITFRTEGSDKRELIPNEADLKLATDTFYTWLERTCSIGNPPKKVSCSYPMRCTEPPEYPF